VRFVRIPQKKTRKRMSVDMGRYGSMNNTILSTMVNTPEPVIGLGVTVLSWTDREVYRVTAITNNGSVVWLQRDHTVKDEKGNYVYTAYPHGPVVWCVVRKDGKRHLFGQLKERIVLMGVQDEYYDTSF
jgi:hypothetical protein